MFRLTLVKEFTYRGQPEEWSNSYHFAGTKPTDTAAWRAFAVAVHTSERTCYAASSKLVAAYGYDGTTVASEFQGDFRTGTDALRPGTLSPVAAVKPFSGDQAAWLRGHCGTSTTGKKVYVRKYFHDGYCKGSFPDELDDTTKNNYIAHGQVLKAGTLPGSATWCDPDGGGVGLTGASQYVTTRTLKRRGKRPTAP